MVGGKLKTPTNLEGKGGQAGEGAEKYGMPKIGGFRQQWRGS